MKHISQSLVVYVLNIWICGQSHNSKELSFNTDFLVHLSLSVLLYTVCPIKSGSYGILFYYWFMKKKLLLVNNQISILYLILPIYLDRFVIFTHLCLNIKIISIYRLNFNHGCDEIFCNKLSKLINKDEVVKIAKSIFSF